MKEKYLPIDVSTFSTMITNDYLYIDKTEYIYNLFSKGGRYYFLSRPRRFGKSLLISTLKELFLGNKKLFEGLWIASSDFKWQEHPIIDLDFSNMPYDTVDKLEASLLSRLSQIAETHGIDISQAPTLSDKLVALIQKLSVKNKVVVLIDEYDKPILANITNIEVASAQRDILKQFYDALKSMDAYLRAIFITGVTKFSKTSLFSGLNNVNDISLDPEAAELVGYTYEEIEKNLLPFIKNFAAELDEPLEQVIDKLQLWYNGYRFSKKESKIYNPFSVLYALGKKEFLNYWYQSGTPTFLIHLLKNQYNSLENVNKIEIDYDSLSNFDISNIPLISLLFQTGYLTIVDYDKNTRKFKLNFPNHEVQLSFTRFFVETMSNNSNVIINNLGSQLKEALNKNDLEKFCSVLQTLFAHIPYTIIGEDYYHVLFQFLLSLLSLEAQSEIITNKGRIDLTLNTKTHTYVFELKLNSTPENALAQIKNRGYYERFLHKGKHVLLVGLSFTPKEKGLNLKYIAEPVKDQALCKF